MSERFDDMWAETLEGFRVPKTIHWVTTKDCELAVRHICHQLQNQDIVLLEAVDKMRELPGFPAEWEPGDHLEILVQSKNRSTLLPN